MAKIALGVAVVMMLLSAFFGFQTKGKVTELRDSVKTTTENLVRTQSTADKAKADAKAAQEQAAAEKQRADAATADVATAKAEAEKASEEAKSLQAKIDAMPKTAEGATPVAGGGPTQEEMDKLRAELKDAQAKAAEAEQVKLTLENKAKSAESEANSMREQEQRRKQAIMRPGLEGQVLAVNGGFNFVVLSLGDRQGAMLNA
ncbi:MAG: hypothetical protein QOD99_2093, partial [Chthoniobacter sp.]|nr:hypothetical protein [Chthoniobacter sp.]